MTEFTAHFRFPIPDFTQEPWHAEVETFVRAVDTAIYDALLVQDVGNWTNSTVYAVGAIVIDSATGLMWTCAVANTSSAAPTTFAQERVAHPTYWNATANIPQQRGSWTTATAYMPGDFVIDTNRYAVCIVAHTSGVFNTDLAAGKWSVLIDLSSLGVGINANAEDTLASAATTDLGSKTATRINITGTTNITSFGVVANIYKILRFSGALTLTNSANLILFGADIVTAANDVAFFSSDNTGKWRLYFYNRASGVPLGQPDASETVKGIAELATQAEVDTGVDALRIVTPATLAARLVALRDEIYLNLRAGVGATLDTLAEIATAIGLLAPKANPTFTGTAAFDQISATGTANLAGGTTLPAGDIDMADLAAAASPFERLLYHIRDERASGTNGTALTTGTWNTRTLQTEKTDDLTITLSGNQFALPAGTYQIAARLSVYGEIDVGGGNTGVFKTKSRLRNITDSATVDLLSLGSWFGTNGGITSNNTGFQIQQLHTLFGRFTIAGTKTFELQTWVTVSANLGNTIREGIAVSADGEKEVYADVMIWKIN